MGGAATEFAITKVGAVIVDDGMVLAVRKRAQPQPTQIMVGGKVDPGESYLEALSRELLEELGVVPTIVEYMGHYSGESALERVPIEIYAFLVQVAGEVTPRGEIDEIRWLGRDELSGDVGSILSGKVTPELVRRNLIGGSAAAKTSPNPASLPPPFEWCRIAGDDRIGLESFYMAKYPVTWAQFEVFVASNDGYGRPEWWDGLEVRPKRPATQIYAAPSLPRTDVTWFEAIAYTRWLAATLDLEVGLPTEAEWLRGYSASDEVSYPWGEGFRLAWCNTRESGAGAISPVEEHLSGQNAYGLCDMAGNVWERCLGRFDDPGNVDVAGLDNRIIRGGSWRYGRREASRFHRQLCRPDRRFDDGGFRVILKKSRVEA